MEGSRKTYYYKVTKDDKDKKKAYKEAKSLARAWSYAEPHVIREKKGQYTVMMKKDTKGFPEKEFGPVIEIVEARFSR